jgi:hypothetical protein
VKLLVGLVLVGVVSFACGEGTSGDGSAAEADGVVEVARFPLSDGAIPPGADAAFDSGVSQDGGGSLRVQTSQGGRLRLYRLDDLGLVQGEVVFTGFLRSRGLGGRAVMELWCRPAEGDAAFVRGYGSAVTGDAEWTPQEVRFSNPALCRNPVSIELNVLIEGAGTVWIDNLRLWSVPAG